jgi:hypothetical protein
VTKGTRAPWVVPAVLAVLWLTVSCSGLPRASSPDPARAPAAATPTPASSGSATEGPSVGPSTRTGAAPSEPLLYVHTDGSMVLSWRGDSRADRYVITRLFYGTRALPEGTTTYTWFDPLRASGPSASFVHPELIVVRAMRGATVLHTFTGGESCPSLVFIAARGSGSNDRSGPRSHQGLGSRGRSLWEHLVQGFDTDSTDLPAIAVDYPAVAPGPGAGVPSGGLPASYGRSVRQGVADATRIIGRTRRFCPRADVILFGVSQGAQVIGDTYALLPVASRDRVVRVILFADPLYHPRDARVDYLPAPLTGHGINGERAGMPRGRAVIESWCSPHDAMCHPGAASGRHVHAAVYDSYLPFAADSAVQAVRLRARTPVSQGRLPTLRKRIDRILHDAKAASR